MTIMRAYCMAILGGALAGPVLAAEPVALPAQCAAPDDLTDSTEILPRVVAALHPNAVLDVLVVGSAPMFGRTPPALKTPGVIAFPWRMAEALEAAVPGLKVSLTVKGNPGATAGDLSAAIRGEIAAKPYKLVLWQTGTVEAVRNLPPGDFTQALLDGVDAAAQGGADVLLIDPQYSRFLQAHADVEPYERALEQVSAMPGVEVLRRFDLMRYWADNGQLDLEHVAEADRGATLSTLHSCLGAYLARMLLAGVRS
jgi:acyl-CoA thioesterase-1